MVHYGVGFCIELIMVSVLTTILTDNFSIFCVLVDCESYDPIRPVVTKIGDFWHDI